jgi:hypothetical protein
MDLRITQDNIMNAISKILDPCSSFLNRFALLLFSFIVVSCSSSLSSMYDSNFPLTNEIAKSKTTPLNVKIPSGWFTADDNECNCIDLWLIRDDYSATLNFVPLNFDDATKKEVTGDELKAAVEFSKTFKKVKYGKSLITFSSEETFQINNKSFIAFEYKDDQKRNIRVVVFKYGENFYELSAVPAKNPNLSELYKTQNSVLLSIN